ELSGWLPVFSIEYVLHRASYTPIVECCASAVPDLHILRAIYSFRPDPRVRLNTNFSTAFFGSRQPGANGLLHDVTAAEELGIRPRFITRSLVPAIYVGAAFTHLSNAPIGVAQVLDSAGFNRKGNIFVEQCKLVLSAPHSRWQVPLAISYSNRSDLLLKTEWRGQIGIQYILDSLRQ